MSKNSDERERTIIVTSGEGKLCDDLVYIGGRILHDLPVYLIYHPKMLSFPLPSTLIAPAPERVTGEVAPAPASSNTRSHRESMFPVTVVPGTDSVCFFF